jgi:hypothetical protein
MLKNNMVVIFKFAEDIFSAESPELRYLCADIVGAGNLLSQNSSKLKLGKPEDEYLMCT